MCAGLGQSCEYDSDCCNDSSGTGCSFGTETCCRDAGASCRIDDDCCTGNCEGGTCQCSALGLGCGNDVVVQGDEDIAPRRLDGGVSGGAGAAVLLPDDL